MAVCILGKDDCWWMTMRMTSSANKLILWCDLPTVTPEMDGPALIRAASYSLTMLNITPCLVPLVIANFIHIYLSSRVRV